MTYFTDMHSYLHQSSLLIQAYPDTRISTKYSLPRKPTSSNSQQQQTQQQTPTEPPANAKSKREVREPAATLTLKTFHPHTGICLKYQTDKAAEVGRLMTGLGRLAKGEIIEMPSDASAAAAAIAAADAMEVDTPVEAKTVTQMTQQQGGGQGKKKKKGKK